MAAEFLHSSDGIDTIITELKETLETYSSNVGELEKLINGISDSEDWKDRQVKTAFLAASASYIEAYKKYISGLQAYINALSTKSGNILDFEETFSS